MRKVDLSFSIAESVLIPLPADARRVRLLAPDGLAEMSVTFASVVPDGSDDPGGQLVTAWLGESAVSKRAGGVWRDIPVPRAYLVDGEVCLSWAWGRDMVLPQGDLRSGDYMILRQREGVPWDAASPVLERVVYGRLTIRSGAQYEDAEEFLLVMITRLRDALSGMDSSQSPDSAALVEVESPDGRVEKYSTYGALMKHLHVLEQRLSFYRATDGGRHALAGFRLEGV